MDNLETEKKNGFANAVFLLITVFTPLEFRGKTYRLSM